MEGLFGVGGGSLLGKLAVASRWSPAGGSWTCRSQERTSNRFQKVDPAKHTGSLMKQTKNKKRILAGRRTLKEEEKKNLLQHKPKNTTKETLSADP